MESCRRGLKESCSHWDQEPESAEEEGRVEALPALSLANPLLQWVRVCVLTRTAPSLSASACTGLCSEEGPLHHQCPGLSGRPELKLDFVLH